MPVGMMKLALAKRKRRRMMTAKHTLEVAWVLVVAV
jgi:hypothetical protein